MTATPFSVPELRVYPAASATTVKVMAVPTLAVPPDTVAELTTGVFASMVMSPPDSVRVTKAALVLPAASDSTILMKLLAPAALSVCPSTTV